MVSFWFQLPEVLDEMQKFPLFKGVRHILDLEQPDWITREDVHTGLKVLEDRGIPFDLLLRYTLYTKGLMIPHFILYMIFKIVKS